LPVRIPWGEVLFAGALCLWISSFFAPWSLPGPARWSAGLLYIAYDTWLILYVAFSLRDRSDNRKCVPIGSDSRRPSVSVIISARNEVAVLPATLDALLAQDDPADSIWLIDDGSTDDTRDMLSRRYDVHLPPFCGQGLSTLHPALNLISKANSGKADSLNVGIHASAGDLVITLDADTVLHPDAIGAMRLAFEADAELVVAGGLLTPRCTTGFVPGLFEWFQTYEYIRAFIARVAWMRANALVLVSGAFACYRRSAIERVGGFERRSWVEDYEMTHRLYRFAFDHGLPWRVGVLPEAAAVTDAPASLPAFLRQRRRWFGGFLQTLFSYRVMIANPRYGAVGRLMLPIKVLDTLQPVFGITAFVLLACFVARREAVLTSILTVIAVKVAIDFTFLMWGTSFYNRWRGQRSSTRQWLLTGLAALTEPLFFQLLRHVGALLGWLAVLTRRVDWLPQRTVAQARRLSPEG
jgi:cellulose synthase/poly-beta-1,6-N-acetylglucosamine synthase-like glycosyltransferase